MGKHKAAHGRLAYVTIAGRRTAIPHWRKSTMGIPNEASPNVRHNRLIDTPVPVSTSPTGVRSDSEAGGEVRREAYSPVYDRVSPSPAKPYRDLAD
jgi:hypothetical protein